MTKDAFAQEWGFSDGEALFAVSTVLIGQNGLAWLLADVPNGEYLAWSEEHGDIHGYSFNNYKDAKEYVCSAWRSAWNKTYVPGSRLGK